MELEQFLEEKKSRSIIHPFVIKSYNGLTINPYQGCSHRCAYCYATYEWSPEFYDKIYAKSNAPEVLERELAAWSSDTVTPVMVSSATDPYQPAELRFQLTRRCVEVLQKYNVPYYVFTKSALIERDLELHRQYRHNCFIVWSITTCNEKKRRIIEPGTPPANKIFKVINKFADSGLCCGVNIDPIIPLVTDTEQELRWACQNLQGGWCPSCLWRTAEVANRYLGENEARAASFLKSQMAPNAIRRYMVLKNRLALATLQPTRDM